MAPIRPRDSHSRHPNGYDANADELNARSLAVDGLEHDEPDGDGSDSKATDSDDYDTDTYESIEDCSEDFGIVRNLCTNCHQLVRDIADKPNVYFDSREHIINHHSSFRKLFQAGLLGCLLCNFISAKTNYKGPRYPRRFLESSVVLRHARRTLLDIVASTSRSTIYGRLEIAVEQNDPLAQNGTISTRSISPYTTAELCASFAWRRMGECSRTHGSCSSITIAKMPTRVIDVSLHPASRAPRIIRTEDLREPWVALSFCWGSGRMPSSATRASISRLGQGFDITTLPKTFRDAITVTRILGYRYLWVDALCIIQDDPADMEHEMRGMCNIYKGSALTIAVDSASSVSEGFLNERIAPNRRSVRVPYFSELFNCAGNFEIRDLLAPRSQFDVLGSRGWPLQENILSPRTLHIGAQQLFWSCQMSYCSEGSPVPDDLVHGQNGGSIKLSFLTFTTELLRNSVDAELSRTDYLLQSWYKIVSDYVKRSLSFTEDLFPAIAAVAEEVHLQTGLSYRAGLWEQDIHKSLLWYTNQDGKLAPSYRAPSWSWASLDLRDTEDIYGIVNLWDFETIESNIEHLEFHLRGLSGAFYDSPREGSYLLIRSAWIPAAKWPNREAPYCNQRYRQFDLYHYAVEYHRKDGTTSSGDDGPQEGQIVCDFDIEMTSDTVNISGDAFAPISYLLIAQSEGYEDCSRPLFPHNILWCLMLVRTRDSEDEFTRVGLARIPRSEKYPEPKWTTRTVKIF